MRVCGVIRLSPCPPCDLLFVSSPKPLAFVPLHHTSKMIKLCWNRKAYKALATGNTIFSYDMPKAGPDTLVPFSAQLPAILSLNLTC